MTDIFPDIPFIEEEETPDEEQVRCGFYANGTIDYTEGGDNWCGKCRDDSFQQSPINLPLVQTFAPRRFDLNSSFVFGNLRRVWLDVKQNWVQMKYKSDGYLSFGGFFEDDTEVDKFYKHMGFAKFHTPAEHNFFGQDKYDCELEFYFESPKGEMAIVSVFFDRAIGGIEDNVFLDALKLEDTGVRNYQNGLGELQGLFNSLNTESLWYY